MINNFLAELLHFCSNLYTLWYRYTYIVAHCSCIPTFRLILFNKKLPKLPTVLANWPQIRKLIYRTPFFSLVPFLFSTTIFSVQNQYKMYRNVWAQKKKKQKRKIQNVDELVVTIIIFCVVSVQSSGGVRNIHHVLCVKFKMKNQIHRHKRSYV